MAEQNRTEITINPAELAINKEAAELTQSIKEIRKEMSVNPNESNQLKEQFLQQVEESAKIIYMLIKDSTSKKADWEVKKDQEELITAKTLSQQLENEMMERDQNEDDYRRAFCNKRGLAIDDHELDVWDRIIEQDLDKRKTKISNQTELAKRKIDDPYHYYSRETYNTYQKMVSELNTMVKALANQATKREKRSAIDACASLLIRASNCTEESKFQRIGPVTLAAVLALLLGVAVIFALILAGSAGAPGLTSLANGYGDYFYMNHAVKLASSAIITTVAATATLPVVVREEIKQKNIDYQGKLFDQAKTLRNSALLTEEPLENDDTEGTIHKFNKLNKL